jgi:hypothetical protein
MRECEMTDLFYQVDAGRDRVFFRDETEVNASLSSLTKADFQVLELDGSVIRNFEDLFRLSAIAMKYPNGFYGDEEYAPNANAYLEYFDDVAEWIPAIGHVLLLRNGRSLWANAPDIAGFLVEIVQAAHSRGSSVRLVFVL